MYKAKGSRFPYAFASEFNLKNTGNVDLANEGISVIFATSSMDCELLSKEERRFRVFQVTRGSKTFDSDFENFIYPSSSDAAKIHISRLKQGEIKTFFVFSNFAFRIALVPDTKELGVRITTFKRPDASSEDNPNNLTNCDHLLRRGLVKVLPDNPATLTQAGNK